jgi:prepilin-type N-terminal cleavage/methylation domain-containing protein/prepilin-type processing-associated H-X9-DG protein
MRSMNSQRRTQRGFTLVELLVVIGIIALLISILLPALGKVRDQSNQTKCLSNVRQLTVAAMLQANDRKGSIQPAVTNKIAMQVDPSKTRLSWRRDGQAHDWAAATARYLGRKNPVENLMELAGTTDMAIFQCPSDVGLTANPPGYWLYSSTAFTDLAPTNGRLPISYAINADVASIASPSVVTDSGSFVEGQWIGVYKGPKTSWYGTGANTNPNSGAPLGGKITSVYKPSETMLFADGGTLGPTSTAFGVENPLTLAYSSHWTHSEGDAPGTMENMIRASWMSAKVPLGRHDRRGKDRQDDRKAGKLNVGFVDGHAEAVLRPDFRRIRLSPYKF